MIKRQKKTQKQEKQYQQYIFRIPERRSKQFEKIRKGIEKLHGHYKKTQAEEEYTIKRNDIIIEALEVGLKKLQKDEKL